MTAILKPFLAAQAADLARQVAVLRGRVGKAEDEDERRVQDVLDGLDFTGWTALTQEVAAPLAEFTEQTGTATLVRLGIDVSASPQIANVVNEDALGYASQRAAEMVGMRLTESGELVPNPDAQWQITESTREFLRDDVRAAMNEGWSNQRLAKELESNYAFSPERAMLIARTETQKASNAGALISYRQSGVVDGKQWLTAEDDLVSPECQENGEAGENGDGVLTDWDAEYPSGDVAPPSHPNCRCTLIPWFKEETAQPQGGEA